MDAYQAYLVAYNVLKLTVFIQINVNVLLFGLKLYIKSRMQKTLEYGCSVYFMGVFNRFLFKK